MQVIGAGLPRTGTLSQKVALEMLGFGPCYHMVNVLGDLEQVEPWRAVLEGSAQAGDVLADFQSTVDWPGAYFYRELMADFPDAKVLLSTRDGEAWERSMRATIWAAVWGDELMTDLSHARARIDAGWRAYNELMAEMWEHTGIFGTGPGAEPGGLARAMERYNEEVIATVDPERLLLWSPGDGWEPLCQFLGRDVPEVPFPRLNDSAQFVERVIDGALLALRQWRESTAPAGEISAAH